MFQVKHIYFDIYFIIWKIKNIRDKKPLDVVFCNEKFIHLFNEKMEKSRIHLYDL